MAQARPCSGIRRSISCLFWITTPDKLCLLFRAVLKNLKKARSKALPIPARTIEFKKAKLGDFSGVIGACFLEDLAKLSAGKEK